MTDELHSTSHFRVGEQQRSLQEQLRELTTTAQQTLMMLRSQQDALRARGMSLPPVVFERMNGMDARVQALATESSSVQMELRQLRALAETTALINSTLDVDDVLNQVMDTAIALTGAERGFIMLRNNADELEFRVARDIDRETVTSGQFSISSTIINQVVQTGNAVLTDNATADPRYGEMKSVMIGKMRSILAVPLRVGDMVTGVVYCDNRILAGVFADYELNLLRAFAAQAAVALENARLFEAARAQLAEIARIRDLMTNVFTSIASAVITLDNDAIITSFNAAAERITGRPADEMIGASLWNALPNPSESFQERLLAVYREQTSEQWETTIDVPGIGQREWKITLTPLRDADTLMQGVVIVLDDLTETRQREAQIKTVRRYLPLALAENIHSADLTAVGGQEGEISVVFADVRGFTTFSEVLEPEDLMQIINTYLGAASDAIDLYEGVIDKYLGDAVTALFNTPLNPQPDHAARAVRAAIRLVREVLALHERLPEDQRLYFGIGIHTGLAVLGNVGGSERREFTAMGDAVDVSKWLQENALKGEILCSAATVALVQEEFDFEPVAPRKPTADTRLDTMYRLLGRTRRTSDMPVVRVVPDAIR
ncbi:MAG: adenylate/guanylate cyclase domain-containing protein [Chloroflexota bacterium]|nr:adenylate/guanylate cyclase domain-containing protein [Chloroflexota bacterium]